MTWSGPGELVLGENAWVGGTDVAEWFTKCSRYHVFGANASALPDADRARAERGGAVQP